MKQDDAEELKSLMSGREYCPRCGSGPRQPADMVECPDCGRTWEGPPLVVAAGSKEGQ